MAVHSQHAAEAVREQVSRTATDDGIVVRDGTSLAFTSVIGNQVATADSERRRVEEWRRNPLKTE